MKSLSTLLVLYFSTLSATATAQKSAAPNSLMCTPGELIFSEEKVRFWFPQLTIDVEAESDGAILRARFGPHPHVWTPYVMLYSTSLAILIGCIMLGISQWMVGSRPWGLYLTPASFILSGLVYGASYVGQGLGSLQMLELRSFVEIRIAVMFSGSHPGLRIALPTGAGKLKERASSIDHPPGDRDRNSPAQLRIEPQYRGNHAVIEIQLSVATNGPK